MNKGFEASLLAGALGDATGYLVEFSPLSKIRNDFGENGVQLDSWRTAEISDDTQMTLFAAEGLSGAKEGDEEDAIWKAFLDWYETQQRRTPSAKEGLLSFESMFRRQAPGNTCLMSLSRGKLGLSFGTPENPINESKGCGGVMRSMPFGFAAKNLKEAFYWGCGQAAMTHGHIDGWLPAGILSGLVFLSRETWSSSEALKKMKDWIPPKFAETTTMKLFDKSIGMKGSRFLPEDVSAILGEGWTGDSALAFSVWAFATSGSFEECISKSVNHDGDSDSTGSIAGNLWGAWRGLPEENARKCQGLDAYDAMQFVSESWRRKNQV